MRIATAALAALVLAAPAFAAEVFDVDPGHSHVGFGVKHMVVSTVKGRFGSFSGTITYAPEDLARASVEVTIQTASVDTGIADRDAHLRNGDFLAADQFPTITFKSSRVERRGDGYVAHGTLTMRGVSREVSLPFTVNGPVEARGKTFLGFDVEPVTVNRQDWGVSWSKALDAGGLVVGNEVTLDLSVEAVKRQPEPAASP